MEDFNLNDDFHFVLAISWKKDRTSKHQNITIPTEILGTLMENKNFISMEIVPKDILTYTGRKK